MDRERKRRALITALAAIVGAALGATCPLLPPDLQSACKLAARLFSLLTGV